MALDFTAAARLFMGSEEELARALGVAVADLRAMRATPDRVPEPILDRLATVLTDRGQAMVRVAQLLRDDS